MKKQREKRSAQQTWPVAVMLVVLLAACATVKTETGLSLPFDETGELNGAAYRIRVPAEWNGTLVVCCHGYRPAVGGGKEPALAHRPCYEVTGNSCNIDAEIEEAFIKEGYALAGSGYSSNGYSVSEAIAETLELTNYFESKVGKADNVLLIGYSMGGLVVAKLVEMYPETYDGAVSACGLVGTNLIFDELLAFRLAFDVAFNETGGFPAEWGSVKEIREDFLFFGEGMPIFLEYFTNTDNFAKFEFIRLVLGARMEEFYQPIETYLPIELAFPGALGAMWLATDPYAEIAARVGGLPAQNVGHIYTLQDDPAIDDEEAYLAELGIDADALLKEMNSRTTYIADPAARAKVEESWELTGNITKPVIKLNTFADTLVLPAQNNVIKDTVSAAGQLKNLLLVYTDGVGHCVFSAEQDVAVIKALNNWVSTGVKPDGKDNTVFPASMGFLHDFETPPWPF